MPLKIRRNVGESFTITTHDGRVITVILTKVSGRRADLVVDAPLDFRIHRCDEERKPKPEPPPP